jgi:two-component system, NtrC family, response regulator GlrR
MKILIIEDDLRQLRLYDKILQAAGHQTFPVSTISAAQDLLTSHAFDACITDVTLGLLDGLDFAEQLIQQALYPNMHIVVVSGNPQHRERCDQLHLKFYQKPLSRRELTHAVEPVLR